MCVCVHDFPSLIYKSMITRHDHITSCVCLKFFVSAYTYTPTTTFYGSVSKGVCACACVWVCGREAMKAFHSEPTLQPLISPYVEEERESNPAVTHPSLFPFSCLNSNDQELPDCCGKARSTHTHTKHTHIHTHRGDFPVNPGKRGILTLQLLM